MIGLRVEKRLDIGATLFAFAAAIFWFFSAYGEWPQMLSYWDATPESDPFYNAVKFSARMNRWAAGFSGLSAMCMVIKHFRKVR